MKNHRQLKNYFLFVLLSGWLLLGAAIRANAQEREAVYPENENTLRFMEKPEFEIAKEDAILQISAASPLDFEQTSVRTSSTITQKSETIYLVENTNASGVGSLRWAIEQANAGDGGIINFNLPGTPPFVIQPTLEFPLPSIVKPVTIDGTTQPQYAPGAPVIVLDGTVIDKGLYIPPDPNNPLAPFGYLGVNGLELRPGSGGSVIKGLVIINFQSGTDDYAGYNGSGMFAFSDNNVFESNFLGIQPDGVTAGPNQSSGISIEASNNIIGGDNPEKRNIISGNTGTGISLAQFLVGGFGNPVENNLVIGNYVGTNAAGTAAVPNRFNITIGKAGAFNTVKKNLISGGTVVGIQIQGDANSNIIEGNLIGTNMNGTGAIANDYGIRFLSSPDKGPVNNIIGGNNADSRNIISGNNWGIYGQGSSAGKILNNQIKGNFIGTNLTGTASLPNNNGIAFIGHADENIIGGSLPGEGNVISGNSSTGIWLVNIVAQNSNNLVQGNFIGTNPEGTQALSNGGSGLFAQGTGNIIGGNALGARNIISGNTGVGISIAGSNQVVKGNLIGNNILGTQALPNGGGGISIEETGHIIGGSEPGARNIISGNTSREVYIANGSGNLVKGNYIGTDTSGGTALGLASIGVWISSGGNENHIESNLISGNSNGVFISNGATQNLIKENYVGTNATGQSALGNNFSGIVVNGSPSNIIQGNVVSGNLGNQSFSAGVSLVGNSATNNVVKGNLIGTDKDGLTAIPNQREGIIIRAPGNIIGGISSDDQNIISGNTLNGIYLLSFQGSSDNNQLLGNLIGLNISGQALGNGQNGIYIEGGIGNSIGNGLDLAKNTIAHNGGSGVQLIPVIVSDVVTTPINNSILANSIHSNTQLGIRLAGLTIPANDADDADTGPNKLQNFPEISQASYSGGQMEVTYFVPSAPANSAYPIRVEFFRTNTNERQGKTFLGFDEFTVADHTAGTKTATFAVAPELNFEIGNQITATATDVNGNTSHFGTLVTSQPGQVIYELLVNIEGQGSVTVDGEVYSQPISVSEGSILLLEAVAEAGFVFEGWSGDYSGSDNPFELLMDGNKEVTATFVPQTYTLTLLANPLDAGSVSGGGSYEAGQMVPVSAEPNTGYDFVNWTLSGVEVSVASDFSYEMPAENVTLVANFEKQTFTIAASAGTGGSIDPLGSVVVEYGESQSFVITA
jgi:hypothetical protein